MAETPLDTARIWVEFTDPADSEQRFRCDLTWLTSSWTCIFGSGCPGIYADRPDDGCCTLGAHFTDKDDVKRVKAAVGRARRGRVAVPLRRHHAGLGLDREGGRRAQDQGGRRGLHLPQPTGFPGRRRLRPAPARGAHTARSRTPLKPDVCWQLPIRRTYRTRRAARRDVATSRSTITEYDRRGWGPGGHDLDWYCSGEPRGARRPRAGLPQQRAPSSSSSWATPRMTSSSCAARRTLRA